MNETQAKEMIDLLKSIDVKLSRIEQHISTRDTPDSTLDDVVKELKEANENLQLLQP